jgi:hypothetical protein
MQNAIAAVLVSLFYLSAAAMAQNSDPAIPLPNYPTLARHAQTFEEFVPAGWRLESQKAGDLNGDGRADAVLVLRGSDPRNVIDARGQGGPQAVDTNPRILAVVLADAAGGYDHTLIARTDDPSAQDPLDPNGVQAGGVDIKRGTLQVTLGYFGGDMGRKVYTFRFQSGHFALIGYDSLDVQRSSGAMEQVSVNYATHRMKHSTGSISDDANKAAWTSLPGKPLLTMEQVGDGLDFEPSPN